MGCGTSTSKLAENSDDFKRECLLAHNELREKHGVPPLELNQELCNMAQKHAEVIAQNRKMAHSDKTKRLYKSETCGENVAYSYFSATLGDSPDEEKLNEFEYTGAEATESWYNELFDPGYNYKNPGFFPGTGHFTQLVWKNTKLLGVGRAKVRDGPKISYYVVANYFPPGNINDVEEFRNNVPELL